MMGRRPKSYDDDAIAALPRPKSGRKTYKDTDRRNLYIRVGSGGSRTFWVAFTSPLDGKLKWRRIGDDTIGIEKARERAKAEIAAIREGVEAEPEKPLSFADVAEDWFKRVVQKKKHISEPYVRKYLDNYLLPAWSGRDFTKIRRIDIDNLLNEIEDKISEQRPGRSGDSGADKILGVINRICAYYKSKHEGYESPIVKEMRRIEPKEKRRKRVLKPDELRAVWLTAEANGIFGDFVRMLLLTAQRREKVVGMKWSDVDPNTGVWTIPVKSDREKGHAVKVTLPQVALDIISARPRVPGNPYIFAANSARKGKPNHFSGFSKMKATFDNKCGVSDWILHDLRRTSRTLMSMAGVSNDHAERTLGHAREAIEATYDLYDFQPEKSKALLVLADKIKQIVNPGEPAENVVRIAG